MPEFFSCIHDIRPFFNTCTKSRLFLCKFSQFHTFSTSYCFRQVISLYFEKSFVCPVVHCLCIRNFIQRKQMIPFRIAYTGIKRPFLRTPEFLCCPLNKPAAFIQLAGPMTFGTIQSVIFLSFPCIIIQPPVMFIPVIAPSHFVPNRVVRTTKFNCKVIVRPIHVVKFLYKQPLFNC